MRALIRLLPYVRAWYAGLMTDLVPVPKALPENKFPKTLGPKYFNKIMPWFESFYHEYHRYPNATELVEHFGWTLEQLNAVNSNKFWLSMVDRRGITRPDRDASVLSARQIAAITVLSNFHDVRNPVAKLAAIEVTEEELNGWYRNPHFMAELRRRTDDALDNVAPDAQVALAQAIKKGNFQAVKFWYEITGRAQSPEQVNLKMALQTLIEAVQKHVKDPEVLAAIGEEVESLRKIQGF